MKIKNVEMKEQETPTTMTRRHLFNRMGALALSTLCLPTLSRIAAAAPKGPKWKDGFELAINFEINQPGGTRYHRPFVAVWIEDANGNAVRTLCLWVQQTGRGPRWIPDLRRWYRGEKDRKKEHGGDLVQVISSATRRPGHYSLIWNGRDDDGRVVGQGSYSVCIEAAREHGTYQIIREGVTLGSRPFRKNLGGNIEIKEAAVEYRKRG